MSASPILSPVVDRQFEDLAASWEALPAQTPMQTWMWAHAAARAFTNGRVKLATAGGPSITAVAPLFQAAGSKTLTVLGTELFEITDFSYADASAAEAVARETLKLGAPIFLRSVNTDSPLLHAFQKSCRRRRIMITRPMPGSPWLPLDDSWKDPESHLNSGRRSDLRRARRRAQELGPVRIEFLRPRLDELPRLLEIAFRVESANWKGRINSSLETNPEVGCFYRHYAQAACQRGMLHLGYLWIGDDAVAMQVAVEYKNSFWLLKMGFDETFRRCSPGTLLMVDSLRYAAEHGLQQYAMMGVSEPWNQIWAPLVRGHVSVRIYSEGLGGLYSAIGDGLAYLKRNGSSAGKPFKPSRMPSGLRSRPQSESTFRQAVKNVLHSFVVS